MPPSPQACTASLRAHNGPICTLPATMTQPSTAFACFVVKLDRAVRQGLVLALLLALLLTLWPGVGTAQPVHLRIVGGLAGVNQYTRHEEPFWSRTLPKLSGGLIDAKIVPFDRAGIRGQDMLRLLQLGAVPFGTALVNLTSSQEPLLAAMDLPAMNPDMASLRRSVAALRPVVQAHLRDKLGIELLAVYAYPSQVLFCDKPFSSFNDLRGRRVRVSGATIADLFEALRAAPVLTSFAEIVPRIKSGAIDCAVTGTMSGNTIGLHELTTHLHPVAITWGVSIFAANGAAWAALSPEVQRLIRRQLAQLELAIWDEADRETAEGIACNRGGAGCKSGQQGKMTVVPDTPADRQRLRELLATAVLPRWLARCGPLCASTWNTSLAPIVGLRAGP